jgi:hypothetical protein
VTVVAPSACIHIGIEATCLAIERRSAQNPSRRVVHKSDHQKDDQHHKHRRKTSKRCRQKVNALGFDDVDYDP